ncbi:MAG: KilA-N domain-containing protein [Waterburya sp.]
MTNLTYNGQVIFQREDGYVNATQMAKINCVQLKDFNRSEFASEYLKALQVTKGADFTPTKVEGFGADKTTWMHPLASLALAQWISPEFHVWCNIHIKTLMGTGSTTLVEQPKPVETKLMVSENLIRLNESTLPAAVKQLLIDSLMNEYITQNQPVLEASKERWVGCAQKAEEMGYITNQSTRSKLGKFVKGNSEDLTIKQEERLCNGLMRSIWVYLDSPELEAVIHDYFNPEVY